MKKAFFALLLFLSASSYAQKVELGLNAGANCVGSLGLYPNNESSSPKAGYYFDFRAAINISEKWQLGIGSDLEHLSVKWHRVYLESTGQYFNAATYTMAQRAITAYLFANRKFKVKYGYLYAGTRLGYLNSYSQPNNPYRGVFTIGKARGYIFGFQGGCNYKLSEKVFLNTEIGTYWHVGYSTNSTGYSCFVIPFSVGLHYVL